MVEGEGSEEQGDRHLCFARAFLSSIYDSEECDRDRQMGLNASLLMSLAEKND